MKKILLPFADCRFLPGLFLRFSFSFQSLQRLFDDFRMGPNVSFDRLVQSRVRCRFIPSGSSGWQQRGQENELRDT